jgi:uncharacterized protein (DUF1015 family)
MSTVRPFRGLLPKVELAEKVMSLPYDVMNREEAKEMADGNPFSFLHITRSEIDLSQDISAYDSQVYQKARENLNLFQAQGVLQPEPKSCYYLYQQVMNGRKQVGVVATVSVEEYESGIIKKHEFTRVEKEEDRIRHFQTCEAHTEPVFLTYRNQREIDKMMEECMGETQPLYRITGKDGVEHALYRLENEEKVRRLEELFRSVDYLYIADGHHRCASAARVGKWKKEENPNHRGDEEYNFFMAVVFPESQLRIFDYNRVVKDLNGLESTDFLQRLRDSGFEVEPMGEEPYQPEKKHTFGMFLEGVWYRLVPEESLICADIIQGLDVSILSDFVLDPILGIQDLRRDNRIDFVGGIRGMKELERRCNHDMKVAFAVYPVDVSDLLRVADAGFVMPPKSTWFEPKLASGLFVHPF